MGIKHWKAVAFLAVGGLIGFGAANYRMLWSEPTTYAKPSSDTQVAAKDDPETTQPKFKGKIGKTLEDSVEYWPEPKKAPKGAPNVLIWLLDDCGYGHTSPFGGLVPTPTLERLAKGGLRFTNFHTTALCSPTRAAFLAGRNHHAIGMGSHSLSAMGFPGYNAHVPPTAKSFARILQLFGWATYMIGKWDHTPQWEATVAGPFDRWPSGDGFDHFYGFMSADMNNFNPIMWTEHTPIEPGLGRTDYHISEDMADKAINYITGLKAAKADKPFCMFWATPAVHAPHHAPKDWIEKFRGKYSMGWNKAREMVLKKLIDMGIVPKGTKLAPRDKSLPLWKDATPAQKKLYERQMEAFAAQLAYTDYQFGRIIDQLEKMGELDNTLIIVTSDNGSSGEGGLGGTFNENGFFNGVPNIPFEINNRFLEQWGNRVGIWHFSAAWTQAGNTPFGWFKQSSYRGGQQDPLIICWPKGIPKDQNGSKRRQYHHIIDVCPTILEACQVTMPKVIDGVKQQKMDGISMKYTFGNPKAKDKRTVQYYEMFGNRGIYADGWTAVTQHRERRPWDVSSKQTKFEDDVWQLFHVAKDFSQSTDLAKKHPEKLEELKKLWDREAKTYNVYPLDANLGVRLAKMQSLFAPKGKKFTFYPPGAIRVHESASPNVKNKSHTFSAEVEIPSSGAEGMLVTAGGRASGYGLYVKNNRLVYVYNYLGIKRSVLTSTTEIPTGKCKLGFKFVKTGNLKGRAELYINGKKAGSKMIPKTIPGTFSIEETFDVGRDTGSPIIEDTYELPFRFSGHLEKLVVTLGED